MPMLRTQADISSQVPMPTDRVDDTSVSNAVAAETIVWSYLTAGAWAAAVGQAAGTVCTAKTTYTGILNSFATAVGSFNDTGFSFAAATRFDALVTVPEKVFSDMVFQSPTDQKATILAYLPTNGNYAIDHRRGQLWGKAKAIVANDTGAYSYATTLSGGGAGDKVDIVKYGGTSTTLGQKTMAASMPVTIASDQPATPAASPLAASGVSAAGTVSATNGAGGTQIVAASAKRVFTQCQNNGAVTVYFGTGTVDNTFLQIVAGGTFMWMSQEALKVLSSGAACNIAFNDYLNA